MSNWESSAKWYNEIVSEEGHYYHSKVILPKLLKLFRFTDKSSLLDIGCGQGILSRKIPPHIRYVGLDGSKQMIKNAKRLRSDAAFYHKDATLPFDIEEKDFSHACFLLSFQNIHAPLKALREVRKHMINKGKLFLVLNHPCFRIPKHTHWGYDKEKRIQYRRLDRYLSPIKIPIVTHPGKDTKETTTSFHHSLSSITSFLQKSKFQVVKMEEWVSDKVSEGGRAKAENFAREEFPLFLTIIAEAV